ncbi:MAG: tetratricopeptide repeat protein [Deltaproteobacteria bacterium]|nr:tetratricopeptide repeat protein [Deltaproteobacteria bacterium]
MVKAKRALLWILLPGFLAAVFLAAWHKDPDFLRSTSTLFRQAQEAADRGDNFRARELARKIYQREPTPNNRTFLAWIYLKCGDPQAALELSQKVLDKDPGANGAVKLQAQALDLLDRRPEALILLARYLKDQPDDREILAAAGDIASKDAEDHALAAAYYQRLYLLDHDPLVRRHLMDLLASLKRYPEAIALQEEEAAEYPENQESLHRLALLHYWRRDYQAAGQVYQRLLEKAADSEALRLEAARTAEAGKDGEQALSHYLRLYAKNPGKKEHALSVARLWSQMGRHTEAAAVLEPWVEGKGELELRRWYALELLLIKDFSRSLRAYEEAWRQGDSHQETVINLARLYARQGNLNRAAAFWDEAGHRHLLNQDLRWEAALTYSYAGRYREALEAVGPLRRVNPDDPKLILFSGQMHFYQKHWGEATRYFMEYLERRPQDFEVRGQLAEILSFGPETRDAALEQYQEALKLKDDLGLRLRRVHLLLEDRRWEEGARELKACPEAQEPALLKVQAHLWLWLGDLETALKFFDLLLRQAPQDQAGRLEKARIITYLGRTPEALELINRLRQDLPENLGVRMAGVEAHLAARDCPRALTLAQKELEPRSPLSLDARALLARCYFYSPDPQHLSRAVDLLVQNLRENRHHHPSLLILAALLPKLPRYEDLDRVMNRIPGIRVRGPEHAAALAYFTGKLGRQAGKLDYLLHVLKEYRRHKWPKTPGELMSLGWLAVELGERQEAAGYYRRALNLRPQDKNIARMLLQCQMAMRDWGPALDSLAREGGDPAAGLEMARVYLMRGQYEGVKAAAAKIPEGRPERDSGLLLLAQACRLEGSYAEALKTLSQLEGRAPRETLLMEKARTLEAMGDRKAIGLYREVVQGAPHSQAARVAQARQARAQGNWAEAHRAFAAALKEAPQDVELLNELEEVRQQMRPQVASRGFPQTRGLRSPEEGARPWQFSRFDRESGWPGRSLGLSNYLPAFLWQALPMVQPESLYFSDSNKLQGGLVRLSGGFWVTKVLPVSLALEYRVYKQDLLDPTVIVRPGFTQLSDSQASRLQRAEVALGAGPLSVTDRLQISGEIIGRRYWKRVDHTKTILTNPAFPLSILQVTEKEERNRIMGSVEVKYRADQTEVALKYSRRDIFDQESFVYPRLYQGVLNLEKAQITAINQVDLGFGHQFRPGLDWRGNLGGALFSDHNRRLTLYQGLAWQAWREPRMHLEFTPHFYLASYRLQQQAYFSPRSYTALGLGVDFDRQIFRLPTFILQGTIQAVNQRGQWGPALQGLAALEWEWVQNFVTDVHVFYFREFVDQYRLFTAGVSLRYRF